MAPALPPLRFLSPLHKATRRIGACLEGRMAALGLTNPEGHALAYLASHGPCPVGRLLEVFGWRPSTLTSLLDRAEAKGLVRRRRNPDDRRSLLVDLTPEGRRRARRVRAHVEGLEAEIDARVEPGAYAGFLAVLAAVGEAADALRPAPEEVS